MPPTSRQYRDAVGMFATGITVVTARAGGFGHGMTANSFTSVSLDSKTSAIAPPPPGWCLTREATGA